MNEKAKQHLQDHQWIYISAGVLVVGIVIGKNLGGSQTIVNTATASPVINNVVSNGGHMRKFVECVETGEMWRSVKDAAEAMGVSASLMSKHLNGHKDHVSNLHFVISGLGTK